MDWTIIVILVALWLLGLISGVGGSLIHVVLGIAALVFIYNLLMSRRAAS
jgi:hypothetical protein